MRVEASYLSSGILASDTLYVVTGSERGLEERTGGNTHVWSQFEIAATSHDILVDRIVQVTVEDLFRERQGTLQSANVLSNSPKS